MLCKTSSFRVRVVLCLVWTVGVCPVFGGGLKVLYGHVPAVVSRLQPLGGLPATNELYLAIGVPLRDPAGLDRFLAEIYDPASPNYRHFLTPAEFTARFSATAADYAAVKSFALTNGFKISGEHGNRLLLDVTAKVPDIERAFHIHLRKFHHPTEHRDFFAPDAEPTVDAALPVADIQGLSDYSRPHPKLVRKNVTGTVPKSGSAPDGYSYLGNDFRNAYASGTALTGAGQQVGLLQFDGYYPSDIAAYAALAGGGRTNIVIQRVATDSYNGTPTSNGNGEVSLDIEMAMAMAPGLAKIVVFEADPNTGNPNTILAAMVNATNTAIKQFSSSWGWGGGANSTTENYFKQMASQGQSYFNASGDGDAFATGSGNDVNNSSQPTYPSGSPNIMQVGGTELTMNGTGASYASESVWNDRTPNPNGGDWGSSGGISTNAIPTWQQGISMAANGGSVSSRNIPDVALTADYCYVDYGNGSSGSYGGTSCAAPLWAGFMALVNQQVAAATGSATNSVGFINPAIYEIARESIYNAAFHDTASGDNTWPSSPNLFYAVPGYDLCTGLGTPAGTNLINALVNPDPLVVVSNAGFNAVSTSAGTFNISSQTFYLTNVSAAPLTWSLINTSTWLNVSSGGGALAAGAGNAVVVSLNTVASNLPAGTYSAGLWFSNVTSGVAHSRFFTLTVSDPLVILPTNNFSFAGPPGGPFAPASESIILTNAGSSALSWSLNNTSAWFNVSPSGGSLAGGAQTNVTFTPTPAVTNLADGNYSAVFQVTNVTSQSVQAITCRVQVPIVQNGGFETGDYSSWTLNDSGGPDRVVSSGSTSITPYAGTYAFAFGQANSLAYLSQSFPTTTGQPYLLSFWLSNPTAGSNSYGQREQFQANWNGTTLTNLSNPAVMAWTKFSFLVTATGTSTVLQFAVRNDPDYFGLDDVSVVPVFAPSIATQPTNLTILSGSNAVFTVTASGSTPFIYQWRKSGTNLSNGGNLSGATSNVLTLAAATTNNNGSYSLFITNAYGSITSAVATLTVVLPPAITSSSLTNHTLQCGSNTNAFTVTATGTPPLNYQWSLDGTPVLNATNTSYSVTNLHVPNHTVSVVVTNLYASLASNALLTVQDTIAPAITLNGTSPVFIELGSPFTDPGATATDVCAGAVSVIASGAVNTNVVGTNTVFYIATDGSNSATNTRTVIVRDTTPPTILWSFTNLVVAANSNCAALMTNVTGTNFILATDLSGALTITQNPTNNFLLPIGTNTIIITVQDASSNAVFSTNTIVVQDQSPPVILSQPQSQTNFIGATATFSVAAAACTSLAFQWYSNNAALTIPTNSTLVLSNLTLAAAGNYYVVASADGGSSTSLVATLTVNLIPPGINGVTGNPDGSFSLNLTGSPGYTYILEATTNLFPPGNWLPIATNTLGTNGTLPFTDTSATNFPQQFYRLQLAP
jgi:hypothetical protein